MHSVKNWFAWTIAIILFAMLCLAFSDKHDKYFHDQGTTLGETPSRTRQAVKSVGDISSNGEMEEIHFSVPPPNVPRVFKSRDVVIAWNSKKKTCFIRQSEIKRMVDLLLVEQGAIELTTIGSWMISPDAMRRTLRRCAAFYEENWPFSFQYLDGVDVREFGSFEDGLSRITSIGPHEIDRILDQRHPNGDGMGFLIIVVAD